MILQLTPDTGKRTYEHETVYVVGNRKALESYDKLSKVCKCVQSIYNAKRVQIKCIVKRRKSTHKRSGSEKPHNISAEENPKVPANEGDDGSRHTLLEMPQIASESTSEMRTQTRNLFKTMKKRNVSTYINEIMRKGIDTMQTSVRVGDEFTTEGCALDHDRLLNSSALRFYSAEISAQPN